MMIEHEPRQLSRKGFLALVVVAFLAVSLLAVAAAPKTTGEDAVKFEISVEPKQVAAGGQTQVTLRIAPKPGYKLNRYPKIKVTVPAVEGLVEPAEAALGNEAPPPADQLETNYFKTVDPLRLQLKIAEKAPKGHHDIQGKLSYFYCVAASGYCAPAKVAIKIPLSVR
jgi:hypothetical protein